MDKLLQKFFNNLYNGDNKLKILDQRYLPRWTVVLLDVCFCVISWVLVFFILEETKFSYFVPLSVFQQGVLLVSVNLLFFFIFKTYSGIIRHSTFFDIFKLVFSAVSTASVAFAISYVNFSFYGSKIFLTASLLFYMLVSFMLMLLFRISVKEVYQVIKNTTSGSSKKRIALFGVDDHTISVGKALTTESNLPFQLAGFLSDSFGSKKYKILGKPVIPLNDNFSEIISKYRIGGVLIISESLTRKQRNTIVDECLANDIEMFNVPLLETWNKKEDIKSQIKLIQIEDLLERDPITIENEAIKNDLQGKTILVTGGAGSIGSEIVRQLAEFNPKLIVILDQAESALHELEIYLRQNFPTLQFITELANISNMYRLEMLFDKYDFEILYHAAAYKHVPLIERNPLEAIYVNILGTVNLSVLSVKHNVDKFVMVSTDKAVNPTNVMGASKRAAEMYVQSLQNSKELTTRFITTRFGNVLGSNGSVIPHFRRQIAQGGPVTVTHKDIIRYFMTIPEACQLVLQAGTMGVGGEIFVFDMGEPIRILDMAERMIRLSGLEPYEDIDIHITGLRPGEKLYEELLSDTSTSLPTHHPKIMISKVPCGSFEEINVKIKILIKTATRHKDKKVVKLLKELVPEFISKNSEFEVLDSEHVTQK
jgi:FlaA1/EpsC-like NDP-sugar epimerase